MSNRVEDLERQVAELRATVDGLTEELVETKERLRQLEDAAVEGAESDADGEAADAGGNGAVGHRSDVHSEMVTTEDRHLSGDADADAADEAEADKAAEGETSDDGEESEGSDIIVA